MDMGSAHILKSADSMQEFILSFHNVGSGDQIQVVGAGDKYLAS